MPLHQPKAWFMGESKAVSCFVRHILMTVLLAACQLCLDLMQIISVTFAFEISKHCESCLFL